MRRDSRPGRASCCRLVTKRTKFNLHFAFMPPFQIGEEQLGQEVVLPSARWNLLRSDTRERSRCIRLAALRTGARRRRENGRLRGLFCRIERITRNKEYYSI